MKFTNLSTKRNYSILRSKGDVMATWTSKVKPVQMTITDEHGKTETVQVFANPEKSDYIYFRWDGLARCVWAKDKKEFDFLKEKKLTMTERGREYKARPAKVQEPVTPVVDADKVPENLQSSAAQAMGLESKPKVKVVKKKDRQPKAPEVQA